MPYTSCNARRQSTTRRGNVVIPAMDNCIKLELLESGITNQEFHAISRIDQRDVCNSIRFAKRIQPTMRPHLRKHVAKYVKDNVVVSGIDQVNYERMSLPMAPARTHKLGGNEQRENLHKAADWPGQVPAAKSFSTSPTSYRHVATRK